MGKFFSAIRKSPSITSVNTKHLNSVGVFLTAFVLYVATLAPSVIPGDPGEYQFIPHILGIAHPPGYAFFTVLAKIWTVVVQVGSVAYRSNLLAATAGAWTVLMVYQIVLLLTPRNVSPISQSPIYPSTHPLPALFAAAVLATSTDLWQHSLHANSHVVSAALSATTLYAGLRWWATSRGHWLYGFAFLAALGVTHHPLLAFGAPAFVAFVLAVRPGLLRDGRSLTKIGLAMLLGLSIFLYLPLRAGATPFGPTPTWDGLVGHATARGIRGNLFYFGWADQPVRLRVFWELLLLQYAPPVLFLALVGVGWLAWRRPQPFLLLAVFYIVNLAFIINTVQDVMAYLLLPFTTTAVFTGVGTQALFDARRFILQRKRRLGVVTTGLVLMFFIFPLTTAIHQAPRISLRHYRLADDFINAVFEQFAGTGAGAVLLAPWEGLTPLWYAEHVEGRKLDPTDVQLVFVASGTANPWVENVWANIEKGPLYLADYRPQVTTEGFRLRPVGDWPFYQVIPPPATPIPAISHPLELWAGHEIQLLGWDLDQLWLHEGETAHLTLFMRASHELTDYYMPYARLGNRLYRWTTDSRLNTPWWKPGEIVVERYEITAPFGTPPGVYPLALGMSNVSQGQDLTLSNGSTTVTLPVTLEVQTAHIAPPDAVLKAALANINSRIVLLGGQASAHGHTVHAPWTEPLLVHPGDSIQVWLDWRALSTVDQPYTTFVHLIDASGRPWAQHDYTPMGGAFPTFLWIPRWLEGQTVSDPYRLTIPAAAPPGDYWIEIGMYSMTSLQRAYHFDRAGNLAGDRYIMGPVRVQTP
jgi:hypothetical protein